MNKKKLLALLMALVMTLTLVPVTVIAEELETVTPIAEPAEAVAVESVSFEAMNSVAEGDVAKIGDTGYATLKAAFAAATDGDTITLLGDCNGDGIKVDTVGKFPNGLTVDFGGHTYSVTGETVGSAGTETIAFQLYKGNKITFKNGTITGDNTVNTKLLRIIQNYSDLTLDNMTISLTNKYINQITVSNCCGTVVIKDSRISAPTSTNGNITTGCAAMAVGTFNGYNSVSVGVTGTSVITGDIKVEFTNEDGAANLSLTGGTVNGSIVLGTNADKVVVTKDNSVAADAPAGYYWQNGTLTAIPENAVAQIGSTEYATLAAAIAAVPTNGTETTITMIGDEAVAAGVTIAAGQNIILELNGKTVSGNTDSDTTYALITNKGTLTIQDNSDTNKDGNGSGLITTYISNPDQGDVPGYASNTITNNGNLTVKSGKIVNNGSGYACYAIDNQTNGTLYSPVLNIEGGRMEQMNAYTYAVRMFCNSTTDFNTVSVSGGVITGGYGLWLQTPNDKANKASLTISGGKLYAEDGAALYIGGTKAVNSNIAINVSGGEIGGTGAIIQGPLSGTYGNVAVSGGRLYNIQCGANVEDFISGGVFTEVPKAEYIADGYAAMTNDDANTKAAYPFKVAKMTVEVDTNSSVDVTTSQSSTVDPTNIPAESKNLFTGQTTNVSGVKLSTTNTVASTEGGEADKSGLQAVVDAAKATNDTNATAIAEATSIDVDVKVTVTPTAYTNDSTAQTATFKLKPKATVKATKTENDVVISTTTIENVAVDNDMIDQLQDITVNIYTGFAPAQIIHRADNGEIIEVFNAGQFDFANGVATVTIHHFSTLEVSAESGVAEINGHKYATLADAFEEAAGGDTITLLQNVNSDEQITCNNAHSFTLDLGGKTLTSRVTFNAGTVTVQNGTIVGRFDTYDTANVTLAASAAVNGQAVVWGDGTNGETGCKTPTLNVYGTINNTGDSAISTNGTDKSGAIINIYDGANVTSTDEIGIYLPSGHLTISGGTVTGTTAVYIKSGSLTISGGTITGNGAKADYTHNGNGGYATGDAIVIESCEYPNGAPSMTVTASPTISSSNGVGISDYTFDDTTKDGEPTEPAVTVNSNTISLPEGEIWVANGDGNYVIAKAVAQIGETKYASLAEAFAAAQDGQTINVLMDSSGAGIIAAQDKFPTGLTVNFNGHTYTVKDDPLAGSTGTKTQAFQLLKGNKITFNNGTIIGDNANVKMLIQNYADLTLNSMTLNANTGTNNVGYVLSTNNGNTVINNTTITAKTGGVAFDVDSGWGNYQSNSVEVKGSSVITGNVEVAFEGKTAGTPSELTLTSGTLNGNIVAGKGFASTTVTKEIEFNNAVPEGYEWVNNVNGTSTLRRKAEVNFEGGSLRKRRIIGTKDEIVYNETDLRFGFTVYLPKGAVIDNDLSCFTWYKGDDSTNSRTVKMKNVQDIDDVTHVSNLVLNKVTSADFDTQLHCMLKVVYTLNNTEYTIYSANEDPNAASDDYWNTRSVHMVADSLKTHETWGTYASALLNVQQ